MASLCTQIDRLPSEEARLVLKSIIFADFRIDFPKIAIFDPSVMKSVIQLQWTRYGLKYGRIEKTDPELWAGDFWHRRVVSVVIRAILPEKPERAAFLKLPLETQLRGLYRIDRLLEKIYWSEQRDKFLLFQRLKKLPEEVASSLKRYMLFPEHIRRDDKAKMLQYLASFLENLSP